MAKTRTTKETPPKYCFLHLLMNFAIQQLFIEQILDAGTAASPRGYSSALKQGPAVMECREADNKQGDVNMYHDGGL